MKGLSHKGYVLAINELPNFERKGELYRGTSIINGKKWVRDNSMVYLIESEFQSYIDNLKPLTYEEVCHTWVGNYQRIDYKGRWLSITARKRAKDSKVVYLGKFYSKDYKQAKSIESIHYEKVITKFERFVDEYCTDWEICDEFSYRGYKLWISTDAEKDNFFGTSYIHKNSTFKCISKFFREVKDNFIARIDQIYLHKNSAKMTTPKEDRVRELEAQIAELQHELEKVKNEKDILVYKGVTLEYGREERLQEGYMIGRIKNAPEGTKEFYRKVASNMQADFEEYIDDLQKSAQLYCELTNKRMIFNG